MKKVYYSALLTFLIYTSLVFFLNSDISPIRAFVVRTGSMEPALSVGDFVLVKEKPGYQIGEVITFKSDPQQERTITHRVDAVVTEEDQLQYQTQGDANPDQDTQLVKDASVVGQVIYNNSLLGQVWSWLMSTAGKILLIFAPMTFFVGVEMKEIVKEL